MWHQDFNSPAETQGELSRLSNKLGEGSRVEEGDAYKHQTVVSGGGGGSYSTSSSTASAYGKYSVEFDTSQWIGGSGSDVIVNKRHSSSDVIVPDYSHHSNEHQHSGYPQPVDEQLDLSLNKSPVKCEPDSSTGKG